MATMARLLKLGTVPILCLDGSYGLVIQYGDDEVGLQVPGEDDIRWLGAERIDEIGVLGALVEVDRHDK